jgi:cytoskeletal protein RodZ
VTSAKLGEEAMMEEEQHSDLQEQPPEEVGQEPISLLLKRRREAKGLSLQATTAATRVPLRYLRHLEGDGPPDLLSDELYLVPFLRTYATFLDLDSSSAVAEFVIAVRRRESAVGLVQEVPRRALSRRFVFLLLLTSVGLLVFFWISGQQG